MDLSDPTHAVTPSLDGPVLAVLAGAGRPLTVGEVTAKAVRGSEIGIRKVLARLVEQGIVRATVMGRNRVHELNRDHVAAEVADVLAGLRNRLWQRLRDALAGWDPKPVYAAAFGSTVRGDGDADSDIDVLLVHPIFPGDAAPRPSLPEPLPRLGVTLTTLANWNTPRADPERWYRQVDRLKDQVHAWTGNRLQVVDLTVYQWQRSDKSAATLLDEVARANVELVPPTLPLLGH